MRTLLILVYIGFSRGAAAQSGWTVAEETTINSPVTGSIRKGHVFTTASKNLYEVTDYVYLYEYLYTPKVIVLQRGSIYRLIIDGIDEPLYCRKLNGLPTGPSAARRPDAQPGSDYIESYISTDFSGLKHGNIYKLANGQIWEQTEPWIWVWVWVMPKVQIYNTAGVYKMKVENIDHAVTVQRLK